MKIKLGCKYQTEVELKGPGIEITKHYDCVFINIPIPEDDDIIHKLNCPICNDRIMIYVTGKKRAKFRRKIYFWLGMIILIPFCLLMYHYISLNDLTISRISSILFLAVFFSGYPFAKAIANKFYKNASVYDNKHKILKN